MKLKLTGSMKDWPLEYRLLLRLVTLAEQLQTSADLEAMSREESVTFATAMQAMNRLIADRHVEATPTCVTGGNTGVPAWHFTFKVEPKAREAVRSVACSYRRHLLAKAAKAGVKVQVPRRRRGLPPVSDEDRQKWMAKAKPLAAKLAALEKDHIISQLAACIARIGVDEVKTITQTVCETKREEGLGPMQMFFNIYSARRDELIPPEPLP